MEWNIIISASETRFDAENGENNLHETTNASKKSMKKNTLFINKKISSDFRFWLSWSFSTKDERVLFLDYIFRDS